MNNHVSTNAGVHSTHWLTMHLKMSGGNMLNLKPCSTKSFEYKLEYLKYS